MSLIAPFRLRILFRSAFLLLALAALGLALYVLQQEKQLSYRNYQYGVHKTEAEIVAKLRHPAGQLALLNPHAQSVGVTPLHPLLLPFSALDFDDQNKVQQAVEMAGCLVQYDDHGAVCTAIGSNPYAGGYIYVAGDFLSGDLASHQTGEGIITNAHRVRVQVKLRGQTYHWIAPFELMDSSRSRGTRGRLAGFVDQGNVEYQVRPIKEFRGWLWQSPRCAKGEGAGCQRKSFFSVRLPVPILRDEMFDGPQPVWPPADLDQIQVHVQILAPGEGAPLLDSDDAGAVPPFALSDLAPLLLPGETLHIRKLPAAGKDLIALTGAEAAPDNSWRVLDRIVRRLPVEGYDKVPEQREEIATSTGSYEVVLTGDLRGVNRSLSVVATRVSWFVGAMLWAILLVWFVIETSVIRRITVLTKRAAGVAKTVKGAGALDEVQLGDLRGEDELGVLAACLADLLQRVREDVAREQIRTEQEKDMWHAVGHEIMSPLQSLMVLHGDEEDPSYRYIQRMQQAIRVLYGSASPSEAFQSTKLQIASVDIDAFLANVAENAPLEGIADVHYTSGGPVLVRAHDYSLEDVVTHVLRNADRYRTAGTPITITLATTDDAATVSIHNQGPQIEPDMLNKIFEYGVSDQPESGAHGNRGQGLFVARTYMAKMGGTITAQNLADGVEFVLTLQRASA